MPHWSIPTLSSLGLKSGPLTMKFIKTVKREHKLLILTICSWRLFTKAFTIRSFTVDYRSWISQQFQQSLRPGPASLYFVEPRFLSILNFNSVSFLYFPWVLFPHNTLHSLVSPVTLRLWSQRSILYGIRYTLYDLLSATDDIQVM